MLCNVMLCNVIYVHMLICRNVYRNKKGAGRTIPGARVAPQGPLQWLQGLYQFASAMVETPYKRITYRGSYSILMNGLLG